MAISYDRAKSASGGLRLKRKSTVGEDIGQSIKMIAEAAGNAGMAPFSLPKRRANTVEVSVEGSRSKRKYY